MKRILLLITLALTILSSCQTKYLSTKQKISALKKLDAMLGTWVTYSTVYTVFESWKKTNDTTMDGRSIMIMTGDTVLNEQMNIQAGRSYISLHTKNLSVANADVENFKLTKQTTDKIIFEKITTVNPESITYNFITPETMRILMKTDGKSVESYNMKKIIKK